MLRGEASTSKARRKKIASHEIDKIECFAFKNQWLSDKIECFEIVSIWFLNVLFFVNSIPKHGKTLFGLPESGVETRNVTYGNYKMHT